MNFSVGDNVLFSGDKEIANFVPQIIARYTVANPKYTDENHELLLIEVVRNGKKDKIVWSASELGKLDFEKELPGCIAADESGKSTRRIVATYLRSQLAEDTLPEGRCYGQTGWYEQDGGMNFLAGVGFVNEVQIPVENNSPPYLLDNNIKGLHLADGMSCGANAVEYLLKTLMRHPLTHLPVWSYTLFASTRSILQSCGLKTACILYLIANQGYGKTTLVKNLCALYDSSNGKMMDVYDANSKVDPIVKTKF